MFVVLLVLPLVVLVLFNLYAHKSCAAAAAHCCFERVLTLGSGTFIETSRYRLKRKADGPVKSNNNTQL